MTVFWTFGKGLDVLWVVILQFLVRNEITSLTLYHICKVLYQRTFPTWYKCFCGTLSAFHSVASSSKVLENSKRCEFVGVSGRKLCCSRVLELQRSLQKFSFVPVQETKWFMGNTKFRSSGITEKIVRVCKDPLIPSWKPNYLLETA